MIRNRIAVTAAALCAVGLLALLLMYEEEASAAASEAMRLAVNRILPPLFPAMVLSSVIVSLDLFAPLERLIPAKVFRLPDCAGPVILLGLTCGFPVGALTACRLYEDGKLGKADAARLTALASAPSPAFFFGAVGGMWHSRAFGAFLFVVSASLTMLIGLAMRGIGSDSLKPPPKAQTEPAGKARFSAVLCRSIAGAAIGCLNVTAYIVFFRIAVVLCSCLLPGWAPGFAAVSEFSSGCAAGAKIGGIAGAWLTGFSVGFGGLSVFLQLSAATEPDGIPFAPSFITAAVRGIGLGCTAAAYAFFAGL